MRSGNFKKGIINMHGYHLEHANTFKLQKIPLPVQYVPVVLGRRMQIGDIFESFWSSLSLTCPLLYHSSSIQQLLWMCRGYTAICPTAGPVSTQRVRDIPLQCRPATTITAPVLKTDRTNCKPAWSCCSRNSTGPAPCLKIIKALK